MSHLDSNLVTSHKLCCFLTFDLHGQSNNLISVQNFLAFLFIGSPPNNLHLTEMVLVFRAGSESFVTEDFLRSWNFRGATLVPLAESN